LVVRGVYVPGLDGFVERASDDFVSARARPVNSVDFGGMCGYSGDGKRTFLKENLYQHRNIEWKNSYYSPGDPKLRPGSSAKRRVD
jgi:hypothetical protein